MRKDFKLGGPSVVGKFSKILERLGGGKEAKPHSTKKGRIEAGIRRLVRAVKKK